MSVTLSCFHFKRSSDFASCLQEFQACHIQLYYDIHARDHQSILICHHLPCYGRHPQDTLALARTCPVYDCVACDYAAHKLSNFNFKTSRTLSEIIRDHAMMTPSTLQSVKARSRRTDTAADFGPILPWHVCQARRHHRRLRLYKMPLYS